MRTMYLLYPKRSGHALVRRVVESWFDDVKVVDVENLTPKQYAKHYPVNGTVLLQIRSFKNWVASYLRVGNRRHLTSRPLSWWWSIAQEFYGETHYLKDRDVVRVYFDRFFQDRSYRKVLCERLGGEYNESKLNEVGIEGQGSSFDGRAFDGKGQQMNVLGRYESSPFAREAVERLVKKQSELRKFLTCYGEI